MLSFLTLWYEKGLSYSSLNTFRSAVSILSVDKIGEDLMISRFFKGLDKLRPARPKYAFIWDVSIVLSHLRNLHPLEDLSYQDLSEKAIILLALSTGHRAQTLASIKLPNIKCTSNGIEIRIPDRIKTSAHGRFQPLLVLPKYNADVRICTATVVIRYLDVTKAIRNNADKLFLAIKSPHKPVDSQTVSRWIKSVLCKSGIDTSIFSAHSVRHASTSTAFKKGISIDVIRRTAGWTSGSKTFATFYNRPVQLNDECFALAVLDS